MRELTTTEKKRFDELAPNLQTVINGARKINDFYIVCGHRNEHDQQIAFETGKSKVQYPNSKHNSWPSDAVDLCPIPIDWNDLEKFRKIYDAMMQASKMFNISIRAGYDFNGDGNLTNDKFIDRPHYELK